MDTVSLDQRGFVIHVDRSPKDIEKVIHCVWHIRGYTETVRAFQIQLGGEYGAEVCKDNKYSENARDGISQRLT